jgi:hypothetical protein
MAEQEPVEESRHGRRHGGGSWIVGLILLLVGVSLIAVNVFNLPSVGLLITPLVGLAFLLAGSVRHRRGMLVAGGVITGAGMGGFLVGGPLEGSLGDEATGGVVLLCFAGGWALITILSAAFAPPTMWWPLIVAGVMAVVGILLLLGEQGRPLLEIVGDYWPLILVGVGLYLLARFWRERV